MTATVSQAISVRYNDTHTPNWMMSRRDGITSLSNSAFSFTVQWPSERDREVGKKKEEIQRYFNRAWQLVRRVPKQSILDRLVTADLAFKITRYERRFGDIGYDMFFRLDELYEWVVLQLDPLENAVHDEDDHDPFLPDAGELQGGLVEVNEERADEQFRKRARVA